MHLRATNDPTLDRPVKPTDRTHTHIHKRTLPRPDGRSTTQKPKSTLAHIDVDSSLSLYFFFHRFRLRLQQRRRKLATRFTSKLFFWGGKFLCTSSCSLFMTICQVFPGPCQSSFSTWPDLVKTAGLLVTHHFRMETCRLLMKMLITQLSAFIWSIIRSTC